MIMVNGKILDISINEKIENEYIIKKICYQKKKKILKK